MLVHDCSSCKTDCHESYKHRYLDSALMLNGQMHLLLGSHPQHFLMTLIKLDCLEHERTNPNLPEYISLNDALAREAAK